MTLGPGPAELDMLALGSSFWENDWVMVEVSAGDKVSARDKVAAEYSSVV